MLNRHVVSADTSLKNIEKFFLRFFKNHLCALFLKIAGICHILCCPDQAAEKRFFADDIGIVFYVCRSRNCLDQLTDIFHAADIRRQIFFFQAVLQGNQIDRLSLITELHHRVKNNSVLILIKIITCQNFGCNQNGIPVKKHGTNY